MERFFICKQEKNKKAKFQHQYVQNYTRCFFIFKGVLNEKDDLLEEAQERTGEITTEAHEMY